MKNKTQRIIAAAVLLLFSSSCQAGPEKRSFSLPERGQASSANADVATATPSTSCTTEDPHPLGKSIADTYDITYVQVMIWYCNGYAFSDILLALETDQVVNQSAGDLLALLESRSWEEIWDSLGVTGVE